MPRRSFALWAVCTCMTASCTHLDRTETASVRRPGECESGRFRVVSGAEADSVDTRISVAATAPAAGPRSIAADPPIRQVAFQAPDASSDGDRSESGQAAPPAPAPELEGSLGGSADESASAAAISGFTIEALEGMALAKNPSLRQAAASVGKARGFRRQVGLYPNPTVGFQATEVGNEGQAGQQGAFIGQTIVTGDKLDLSRSVADWEIQSTQWEAEAQRFRVLNGVRAQFYRALGAQRRVEIARRLVAVAETGTRAAEDLEQAGQVGRPDTLQARIQLNEVRIVLRNAEVEADAAWRQLAALVGCPELPPASLSGDLEAGTQDRDLEALFAELCAVSPELQAARARMSRARAQIRRQEAQPIPNVELQFGGAHDFSTGDPIANVQVGLPIPVFNRNQGNIDIAHAEHQRAVSDLRRLELDLWNRAAAALKDYRQAAGQVELYRGEILPAAEENLELTEAGYERGEFDLLRALTARRSYFEANLALVNSQVALRQADVLLSGLLLSDGLSAPPDSEAANSLDTGLRDQALSGE